MAEAKQIILFAKKIKLVDKITFIQNLGIMIRSGIPIIDALSVVKEDVENPALSDLIKNLSASLEKGETIHTALRKNPDFLNEAHMGILEAGEVSGQLYESLERIKIDLQKENDLFQKIKGALTYPAVIFMSLIGIGGGIIVVVLPKIAEVFARMGVKKLPITTRVMVAVGTFVSKNLPLSAGVCAVFITVSLLFVASKGGRKILGNLISSIPLVNGLVADMNYTRFSRTLSALVKSGVNIDQSLEISSRVFSEKTKKIMNDEIIKKVRKGEYQIIFLSIGRRVLRPLLPLRYCSRGRRG